MAGRGSTFGPTRLPSRVGPRGPRSAPAPPRHVTRGRPHPSSTAPSAVLLPPPALSLSRCSFFPLPYASSRDWGVSPASWSVPDLNHLRSLPRRGPALLRDFVGAKSVGFQSIPWPRASPTVHGRQGVRGAHPWRCEPRNPRRWPI